MSKIICDICGTSYADTSTQCPICGCVRPAQPQPVQESESPNSGYTYVKGGRFSKSNVKKRINVDKQAPKNENKESKRGGLLLLIAIILVSVAAVCAILWATGIFNGGDPDTSVSPTTPPTAQATDPIEIPCEALTIVNKQFKLSQIGDIASIDCRKIPAKSTDIITFTSENVEIATVDNEGRITAVSNGTTNIVITCGNITESCEIVVGDNLPPIELVLKKSSIVLSNAEESFVLYEGPIPVESIIWESDNEYIASVSNGVVTAHAAGPATITAKYMDQIVKCDVLCNIESIGGGGITEDGGSSSGNGSIGEDGGNDSSAQELVTCDENGPLYYKNDTTINVGVKIKLYLGNSSGVRHTVDWTCDENAYVKVEGNTVTALKSTNMNPIYVSTVFEGKTYTCMVRVP